MKKAIGLTADISTFNTTLPQTRHLNYFMNTNPQRFAKGGDVSQGIPNYPNPNVTSGFLPMALGFDNGGEVTFEDKIILKLEKLFKILDGDIVKFLNFLKDKLGYSNEDAQNIISKITTPSDRQPGIDIANEMQPQPVTPKDTVTTTPSDRQPGIGIANTMPPTEFIPEVNNKSVIDKPSDRQPGLEPPTGAVDVTPKAVVPSDRQPGIGIANEMQPNGGITTIQPDEKDDGFNWPEFWKEILPEGVLPDDKEKITPSDRQPPIDEGIKTIEKDDKEEKITKDDKEEKITKDDKEEKITKDSDGITELPKVSGEQIKRDLEDEQTGLSVEDQKTLKAGADIAAGGIGDIKDKKDVPAWALPMMSAGFAMMASKSPYFMQALGEAGQTGLETYTAQKTAEEDRIDKESKRDLEKAQAAYYRGEGRQPTSKTMVQGGVVGQIINGVFVPVKDSRTGKPLKSTIGRGEAIEILNKNPQFQMAIENGDTAKVESMITQLIDVYNNTNTFINDKMQIEEGNTFDWGAAIDEFFK
jgi:hypothetical protein